MKRNSNKLFNNFDFKKSKFLVQKWKNKEDFFHYFKTIKDPEHKEVFFNQIKTLLFINYDKDFMKKNKINCSQKFWNIKQFYFKTAIILPLMSIIAAIWSLVLYFTIPEYFPKLIILKNVFLLAPSVLFLVIAVMMIIIYWLKFAKLPKKEIKLITNGFKNFQNHFFEFSNEAEIIKFMKLKKVPDEISFSWNDEDFRLFSILYSREIYNRVNHCLHWNAANLIHYWPKKIQKLNRNEKFFYFSDFKAWKYWGFLNPWLKLKKYNDKEIMPAKTAYELKYNGNDSSIIERKRWQLSQENQLPITKPLKKGYKNLFFRNLKVQFLGYFFAVYTLPICFTIFAIITLLNN